MMITINGKTFANSVDAGKEVMRLATRKTPVSIGRQSGAEAKIPASTWLAKLKGAATH